MNDINGDGVVSYLAFGDSITFGVGDTFFNPPSGYVLRLSEMLGINTDNRGVPGERLLAGGSARFPSVILSSSADIVGIMEGANDAIFRESTTSMHRGYQRVINVARAAGRQVMLMTLPAPCCERQFLASFTDSYSQAALQVLTLNEDVRLVDIRKAWRTTCQNPSQCELYNVPEGLHPNGIGYDVIAQTAAAALLGIDVFAVDGAHNLESALGLPAGSVIVRPEVEAQ